MAFLKSLRKFFRIKPIEHKLQKRASVNNPVAPQDTSNLDAVCGAPVLPQPTNVVVNRLRRERTVSFVDEFTRQLEERCQKRLSQASVSAETTKTANHDTKSSGKSTRDQSDEAFETLTQQSIQTQPDSDLTLVAESYLLPFWEAQEVTSEDEEPQAALCSPNWVPLPSSTDASPISYSNQADATNANNIYFEPHSQPLPLKLTSATSSGSDAEDTENGGCPIEEANPDTQQPHTTSPASRVSTDTVVHYRPEIRSRTGESISSFELEPSSYGNHLDVSPQVIQLAAPVDHVDGHDIAAAEDPRHPNSTEVPRPFTLEMPQPIFPINYQKLEKILRETELMAESSSSPKTTSQPLKSKKEGLAARLQQKVDTLEAQLIATQAENLHLIEVRGDLDLCVASNVEAVIKQQQELDKMQEQLEESLELVEKLKAYNRELEHENKLVTGRMLTAEYRHGITRSMLKQCHQAMEESRLAHAEMLERLMRR